MWRLLMDSGLMRPNGTCDPAADLYNIITCPPYTIKVPQEEMPAHCLQQGITSCPQVRTSHLLTLHADKFQVARQATA